MRGSGAFLDMNRLGLKRGAPLTLLARVPHVSRAGGQALAGGLMVGAWGAPPINRT